MTWTSERVCCQVPVATVNYRTKLSSERASHISKSSTAGRKFKKRRRRKICHGSQMDA
jgi:hypothetical protein